MKASIVVVLCVSAAFLVFSAVRYRGQPEPPNNRIKLPMLILATAFFGVELAKGEDVVLSTILIVVGVVTMGFILAGRNRWWMQGPADRWKQDEQSTP